MLLIQRCEITNDAEGMLLLSLLWDVSRYSFFWELRPWENKSLPLQWEKEKKNLEAGNLGRKTSTGLIEFPSSSSPLP